MNRKHDPDSQVGGNNKGEQVEDVRGVRSRHHAPDQGKYAVGRERHHDMHKAQDNQPRGVHKRLYLRTPCWF